MRPTYDELIAALAVIHAEATDREDVPADQILDNIEEITDEVFVRLEGELQ